MLIEGIHLEVLTEVFIFTYGLRQAGNCSRNISPQSSQQGKTCKIINDYNSLQTKVIFHTKQIIWGTFSSLYSQRAAQFMMGVLYTITVGGQREELRPWQRSWGTRLGIRKGVIKPQESPCSRASTPKPESVLFSYLHLWLYGGLSPITVSLGKGVNVQLQGNKNSWAWQECFSLWTPLKVI